MKESFLSLAGVLVGALFFHQYIRFTIFSPLWGKLAVAIILVLLLLCFTNKLKYFFKHFNQIWPYFLICVLFIYIFSITFFIDSVAFRLFGYSNQIIIQIFTIIFTPFFVIFITQLPQDVRD